MICGDSVISRPSSRVCQNLLVFWPEVFFAEGISAISRLTRDDGVAKSSIYCVAAGREMLDVPYVRLRFRNTTAP
ncbi:MAG: hypothetical protein M0017_07715, partial [Desulfobacteraceae bacterium]|nr:hypothetical protein [Desulfobacteraceae bacterium]